MIMCRKTLVTLQVNNYLIFPSSENERQVYMVYIYSSWTLLLWRNKRIAYIYILHNRVAWTTASFRHCPLDVLLRVFYVACLKQIRATSEQSQAEHEHWQETIRTNQLLTHSRMSLVYLQVSFSIRKMLLLRLLHCVKYIKTHVTTRISYMSLSL